MIKHALKFLFCILLTIPCRADGPTAAAVLKSDKLQEPPMQESQWAVATDGAPELWSAAATLFKQGLADPRGCEYREIWLRVGDGWNGDVGLHRYHGWVLPASAEFSQRFAVCWNGLVYPVERIGEPADLARDVKHMQAEDDEAVSIRIYTEDQFDNSRFQSLLFHPSEHSAVCGRYAWPIRTCLLLRLGETELAYRIWTPWKAAWPSQPDPYLVLATQFERGMYDAARNAQMRGDDRLALVFGQTVSELKKTVDEEIKKRNLQVPADRDGFLLNIPKIVADCKQRISQSQHVSALQKGEHAFANKTEWARALVGDLDNFAQWHTGNHYWEDPLYKALISCGGDAVDPLSGGLDCGWPNVGPLDAQTPSTELKAKGAPLPVVLGFANRRAVPVPMPTAMIRKLPDGKLAVRTGFDVSLAWIGEAGVEEEDRDPSFAYRLPMKDIVPMPPGMVGQFNELGLMQDGQIEPFDLRDCFDISQPGLYRLRISFTKESGLGEGSLPAVEFELK